MIQRKNVNLILCRELKDQLRDRRTLFTVLVLPLLLYPVMGIALLQVSQFARQQIHRVWIVGVDHFPNRPQLINDGEINDELVRDDINAKLTIQTDRSDSEIFSIFEKLCTTKRVAGSESVGNKIIEAELKKRKVDVAVFIPSAIQWSGNDQDKNSADSSEVLLFVNSARDKSNLAANEFNKILGAWKQTAMVDQLSNRGIDPSQLNVFTTRISDVAEPGWKRAASWSKILPFIVMIWSLTGAFYPAVDLCAGEKERGTFETLLSSPALRGEIAIGKLLTVMIFSITTSVLNLASMCFTGVFVASRMSAQIPGDANLVAALGLPPVSSIFWLLLALIPISALFSAVALAAASFAKSSKEGQYYLVPLMMISMPLMMLPMMPAAKLDLGSSLIPVSGLMLLLRGLIEGQYSESFKYAGPVVGVTIACCWLSVRWVINQFSNESVIFRPSERFSIGTWVQQAVRERHELPLAGQALLCGILILVVKFFMSLSGSVPENWAHFSKQTVIVLVAAVAMPAVLMAMFLTRRPLTTLKLKSCRIPVAMAAVLLAILLHPAMTWLTNLVMGVYPPAGDLVLLQKIMSSIFADAPGLWAILLVLALAPAFFEEIAFRGFILTGFQSLQSDLKAVVISSLLFGLAHSIIQQSIITFFVGCILGFIALRVGSIIPCILYHFTHNALSTMMSMVNAQTFASYPALRIVLDEKNAGGCEYSLVVACLMTFLGIGLLLWFASLSESNEENERGTPSLVEFFDWIRGQRAVDKTIGN